MADPGSLQDRTRQLVAEFEAQEKGYPFNYSGDGTAYATRFAGLLREWLGSAAPAPAGTVPDLDG